MHNIYDKNGTQDRLPVWMVIHADVLTNRNSSSPSQLHPTPCPKILLIMNGIVELKRTKLFDLIAVCAG